jgi:hypothetical protein
LLQQLVQRPGAGRAAQDWWLLDSVLVHIGMHNVQLPGNSSRMQQVEHGTVAETGIFVGPFFRWSENHDVT